MIPRVFVVSAALMALASGADRPAVAQIPVLQGVSGVQIEYQEPQNPAHRPIFERLKKRQVLEQYKEFMAPLRLKRSLTVTLQGCQGVINAMYRDGRITFCYEFVADVERRVAESELLPGFRREDAVVGGFVNTLLHETGHAIFDLLHIPIFGREEDAADAVAAYVALQFGPSTARRILTGTAFVWRASELSRRKRGGRDFDDYADEHGTDAQRFYNTLCIALGSDVVERQTTFTDFIELLPKYRRGHCAREYLHVKESFRRFVLPHVDEAALKKVRAAQWLRAEDGTDILPPQPLASQGGPGTQGPGTQGPGGPGPGGAGPGGPGPQSGPGGPKGPSPSFPPTSR